ncbi:MAG: HAD family phosphatase [Phycisphaeraceae bacterium]|nr:HAD family phosphatase [Phycisphaeraceae bacterium]
MPAGHFSPLRRFDAVICDIDGCLAPESSAPFNAQALIRVAEHNHAAQTRLDRPIVTVCSGRPEPFVEAMCRLIANRTLPAIAENGVWLYHPSTNAYDRDPSITPEHLRTVRDAAAWVEADLGPTGVVMQPGKSCSISLYHDNTEYLRRLEPVVRARAERESWPLRISMTWLYINCDLAHISKGTALERWIAATGIPSDRLAGIGDTPSDLPIADRVAFFACPGNAMPAIRSRANTIARSDEAEGVVEILQEMVGSQGR